MCNFPLVKTCVMYHSKKVVRPEYEHLQLYVNFQVSEYTKILEPCTLVPSTGNSIKISWSPDHISLLAVCETMLHCSLHVHCSSRFVLCLGVMFCGLIWFDWITVLHPHWWKMKLLALLLWYKRSRIFLLTRALNIFEILNSITGHSFSLYCFTRSWLWTWSSHLV